MRNKTRHIDSSGSTLTVNLAVKKVSRSQVPSPVDRILTPEDGDGHGGGVLLEMCRYSVPLRSHSFRLNKGHGKGQI